MAFQATVSLLQAGLQASDATQRDLADLPWVRRQGSAGRRASRPLDTSRAGRALPCPALPLHAGRKRCRVTSLPLAHQNALGP